MSGEGQQGDKGKGGNHGSKFDANAKAKGQKSQPAEGGGDDEEE